tara:strand:- start:1067 stop:1468 length:402 start_codon:yes stop_codon:yes gene_type:complete
MFNKQLNDLGRKIEDEILPTINKYYSSDFKRNENNIFDVFDFRDEENNIIVEVKGRRIKSTEYKDTIITAHKITEGLKALDLGYQVFFVFVFTDKTYEIELKEDTNWKCMITGSNSIEHYLIPLEDMTEINIK